MRQIVLYSLFEAEETEEQRLNDLLEVSGNKQAVDLPAPSPMLYSLTKLSSPWGLSPLFHWLNSGHSLIAS